jgi:UDP-N-acetylmuramoylalanine--D-glutamate ligase
VKQIAEFFRDKRVLVWGLGREGISTLKFLAQVDTARAVGVMDSDANAVKTAVKSATRPLEVANSTREIQDYDIVLKAPGISVHNLMGKMRPEDFEKISSQTDLFLRFFSAQTIAITGTKGKSTTASLIYHILHEAQMEVLLGGNIGTPAFELIPQITPNALIVLELSSHQLEFLTRAHGAHIVLLLNLFADHLDHYADLNAYHQAKLNAVRTQTDADFLVYSEADAEILRAFLANRQDAQKLCITESKIETLRKKFGVEFLRIGFQNAPNLAFAYRTVVEILGIPEAIFAKHLETFCTLAHRLEYFATVGEVEYYDDSISTIPEATILAVESLQRADKTVGTVILGGMDRGVDYTKLVDFLGVSQTAHVILLPNAGVRLAELFQRVDGLKPQIHNAENLAEAVQLARRITPQKTVCLLSPAAASYGMFKNFQERGNAFQELLKKSVE